MKSKYSKMPGYVAAREDALNGAFIVRSSAGAGIMVAGFPWVVTCVKRRQRILTKTKSRALSIMMLGVDSVACDKWDFEFNVAKHHGLAAHEDFAR